MIHVKNLTKRFGDQTIFDDASFIMGSRERLAFVGRNGYGKSTLFRILLGEEEPDSGSIQLPNNYRVGHLNQHLAFTEPTVIGEVLKSMGEKADYEAYRAESALMGLGFTLSDLERPPGEFSGGYQIRIELAKVIVDEPNLLLLDEPTNYLDILSVRWLERVLRDWPNELIAISHDRAFLDRISTHTMIVHRNKLRRMKGGIDKLVEQIAEEEDLHERTRQNEAKKREQDERFIQRFRAKASKAKAVQSRIKLLDKKGQLDELENEQDLEFQFPYERFHGARLLAAEDLQFGYVPTDPLVKDVSIEVELGDRVAVIGRNGRGKTTLLNLLAQEFAPNAGTVDHHPNVKIAYFGQTNIDRLDHRSTIEQEVQDAHPGHERKVARAICGRMLFSDRLAEKKIEVLSGGERSRVLLAKILVSPSNLLLLDEPTNHLDLESVESLMDAIEAYRGGVILVTHDENMIRRLANRLIIFDRGESRVFEGTYDDFLDRVGWSDEDGSSKPTAHITAAPADEPKPAATAKLSKADKKERAKRIEERSKRLKPVRKRIQWLENEITRLERDVEEADAKLIVVSGTGDPQQIAKLSKRASEGRQKVDEHFAELEAKSDEEQTILGDYPDLD